MFQIDSFSRVPVYEQLVSQIEHFILTGILKADDQIPSVRNLSVSLSINPNTIQKAYTELDRRQLIYSAPGRGSFISANAKEILSNSKKEKITSLYELLNELKLAGMDKDTITSAVEKIYSK